MGITRVAISRHWATVVLFVALALGGAASCQALPINQFPNVVIPIVSVTTSYPGANPQEIESQVTEPIEDSVSRISNVDTVTSTSTEGFSSVTIQFTDAADINRVVAQVEQVLSSVTVRFPSGVDRPVVSQLDLTQVPIMQLALADASLTEQQLHDLADSRVLPHLERTTGVANVTLIGGTNDEIAVEADPILLAAYNVSLPQLQAAIASTNTAVPGGPVAQGDRRLDVQVSGRLQHLDELGDIQIAGSTARVRDVARVRVGGAESTQFTRVNGRSAILISVGQQAGANLTDVTDAVRSNLDEMRAELPTSSELIVVQDSTPFVRDSLTGIYEEITLAVILTSIVLMIFLHRWQAALIVLLSIPTTLLTTFIAMQILGFSLNFLSLLGLTLTIGILVDDSIVVLENIMRRLKSGDEPFTAALRGRAEIGLAALAITLVDVAVFAPVGLVSGQIGGFFREFGFTIAAATLVSLAVSFTLTPMLAAHFLKTEVPGEEPRGMGRFGAWWDGGFERLEEQYGRLLGWSLRHRLAISGIALSTLVAGGALVGSGRVPVEFIPVSDGGYFYVSTEAPTSTSLAVHDGAMHRVEAILADMPEVQTVTASVGVSANGGGGGQARLGSVVVELTPLDSGRRDVFAIAQEARTRLVEVPGIQIKVGTAQGGGGGGGGQPVSVGITGPDVGTLSVLADELQRTLQGAPSLINVTNGAPAGRPQLLVDVDRDAAASLGVNASSVGLMARTAISGVIATKFQEADGTFTDVRLQLLADGRDGRDAIGSLPVLTAAGDSVPLRQISRISETTGPSQIRHQEGDRIVSVTADLAKDVSLSEAQPAVNAAIAALRLPEGYAIKIGGTTEQQGEAFGQLFLALGASVLLAYVLMAVLYNSLLHPLTILFSIPVAIGGAMFGLYAFGYAFSVFSMIGLILLVGLAIKNGILLVDRANHNRERGMGVREALLEAGPARLRPILMTSATIVMALSPVAFQIGAGSELRSPLAATVLGGVISSTLLTLVLIPVVYTFFEDLLVVASRLLAAVGIGSGGAPAGPPRLAPAAVTEDERE